ncbi:Peroxisomal leader peptide-processing protease [Eufriesea mexicana]|uniref:Peroxisomal leader peptide-processing protease n=2 Tax=Eufriesea mexicana TaxID=516756 RepID=A0A310SAW7_9HYME|nr:Peroxisomal leader peptide-processing protease [Eufriesea mexicana]
MDGTMLSHGYSGISIAKRWVLAHGSILAPILLRSQNFLHLLTTLSPGYLSMIRTSEQLIHDLTFFIHRSQALKEFGKVVAIWKCPLLKQTLEDSFRNWTFRNQDDFDRLLIPIFLIIKCKSLESISQTRESEGPEKQWKFIENEQEQASEAADKAKVEHVLLQLAKQVATGRLTKGAIAELVSTPFGNPFFLDSVSRGIIGNLLGTNNCLILMDVTSFPGSEGSPVFLINDRGRRSICGMIIASLSCCRGEWVNCTFAVNLLPSLKLILQTQLLKNQSRYLTCTIFPFTWHNRLEIDTLEKCIAIVKCGSNWGTGTLVDEQSGTFITCAHVVTMAPEARIEIARSVMSPTGRHEWSADANLIYKTPNGKPYDIAVLRVNRKFLQSTMKAIKFAEKSVRKGEQILSIGFPFTSEGRPTITNGVISKTSSYMFQTNCCVHSGVSGGPIVRRADFKMLGIIVCNVASNNGSVSYPRLCMAIPITILQRPLNDYLQAADPKALEKLTEHDVNVTAIWNLRPFLLSNI